MTNNLTTLEKVQKLQLALHAKAKESPSFRFYALYDKIYRADVLQAAYQCCRRNDGAAGVDGQTFRQIEEYGVDKWLGELVIELRSKEYRPQPVRRVHIAKSSGGTRPLGIPTIKDRVVQTSMLLILEPIFEADLPDEQYAYRPQKSAQDAINHVRELLTKGYTEVVDADLQGYFDSIPHAELLKCLARRVCDKHVLHLIKLWLDAPVEETDAKGRPHRTTSNQDEGRGTPQGAPISPLLANIYMRRFVLGWKILGNAARLQAHIVSYADDFVICCRPGKGAAALESMRQMMERLKLTVNETKTRRLRIPQERLEFLGYNFGRCFSFKRMCFYLGTWPSSASVSKVRRRISELTARRSTGHSTAATIVALNRLVRGWANYFQLGSVSRAYRQVQYHLTERVRQWLLAKHQQSGRGYGSYPDRVLYEQLGLIRLSELAKSFPWANA